MEERKQDKRPVYMSTFQRRIDQVKNDIGDLQDKMMKMRILDMDLQIVVGKTSQHRKKIKNLKTSTVFLWVFCIITFIIACIALFRTY